MSPTRALVPSLLAKLGSWEVPASRAMPRQPRSPDPSPRSTRGRSTPRSPRRISTERPHYGAAEGRAGRRHRHGRGGHDLQRADHPAEGPERCGAFFRIMQEADIAYGNLEFSINDRPELQRPFYNFRAGRDFAWEVARTGINLVSLSNNHALDFGPEGLYGMARGPWISPISIMRGPGTPWRRPTPSAPTRSRSDDEVRPALLHALLVGEIYRSKNADGPSLATIDPAVILVAKDGRWNPWRAPGGRCEDHGGRYRPGTPPFGCADGGPPQPRREPQIAPSASRTGRRPTTRSCSTGPSKRAPTRVLGTGPHVLRGIEIHKGRPIFYSLQLHLPVPHAGPHPHGPRSPAGPGDAPPHQCLRGTAGFPEIMEGVLVRMVLNKGKLRRIQLVPFAIDDEGPLYGVPRL